MTNSVFHIHNLPSIDLDAILDFCSIEITDNLIWQSLKEYDEIDSVTITNTYLHYAFAEIKTYFSEYLYSDVITWEINAECSELLVDGTRVNDRESLFGEVTLYLLGEVLVDENGDIENELSFGDVCYVTGTPITEIWHDIEDKFDISMGKLLNGD